MATVTALSPCLADGLGFRVGEVEVNHRPRSFGRSKYGFGRVPRGILDLFTVKFLITYGQRPQHLLGVLGIAALGLGGLVWLAAFGWWAWTSGQAADRNAIGIHVVSLLVGALLVLLGLQLLVAGWLAELVVASTWNGRRARSVVVADRVGFEAEVLPESEPYGVSPRPVTSSQHTHKPFSSSP